MSSLQLSALYQISSQIDSNEHPVDEAVDIFLTALNSPQKPVRMCALQMLFRYFPQSTKQTVIQQRVYGMLADREKDVRLLIINSLPNFCRVPSCAEPVSDVLAQLLSISKDTEQAIVQKSLCKVFIDHFGPCTCAIYNCAIRSETPHEKIRILLFLESHMSEEYTFSERIKKGLGDLYIELITQVNKSDAPFLIQCLSISNNFPFYRSLKALYERLDEEIFDIPGLLLFCANKLVSGVQNDVSELEQAMTRLNFVNKMLSNATLHEFECIVDKVVILGILSEREMEALSVKIMKLFQKEPFLVPNDNVGFFNKLNRMLILCKDESLIIFKSDLLHQLITHIECMKDFDPSQQKNYLIAVATCSEKRFRCLRSKELNNAVFDFVWSLIARMNSEESSIDLYALEAVTHIVCNFNFCTEFHYKTIAEVQPLWREMIQSFTANLTYGYRKLNKQIRIMRSEQVTYKQTLYVLKKSSDIFLRFLKGVMDVGPIEEPTWMSNADLYEGITLEVATTTCKYLKFPVEHEEV